MSLEIYVRSFRDGEPGRISVELLRSSFGHHLDEVEPAFWQLRYDDENWCDLYITGNTINTSFTLIIVR